MLKYLKLYLALLKTSFIADLEYRANFFSRVLTDIFWYAAQIFTFEIIYLHTEQIGQWGKFHMRAFLGILFVIDALYMIIIHENVDQFSEKIRKGDLDLLLVKPINSQFMITLQKANTAIFGNLVLAISWLVYSLSHFPSIPLINILFFIALIPCSLVVIYTMRFFLSSTAIIFTKSDNIQFVWWPLYRLGMRPDFIYGPKLRILLMTILPVGIIINTPAKVLLFPLNNWMEITWPLILSPMLILATHFYWKFVLRYYQSASS